MIDVFLDFGVKFFLNVKFGKLFNHFMKPKAKNFAFIFINCQIQLLEKLFFAKEQCV